MVDSYRTSYYNSPPIKTTNTNSAVELTLFILALFFFFSLQKINISPLFFHPIRTVAGLLEMAVFKLSEMSEKFGIGGLGKVDWGSGAIGLPEGNEINGLPKDYNNAIASGSQGSFITIKSFEKEFVRLIVVFYLGQYYPGLLNAAGNLCFLNATLQVSIFIYFSCNSSSADFNLLKNQVDGINTSFTTLFKTYNST